MLYFCETFKHYILILFPKLYNLIEINSKSFYCDQILKQVNEEIVYM